MRFEYALLAVNRYYCITNNMIALIPTFEYCVIYFG